MARCGPVPSSVVAWVKIGRAVGRPTIVDPTFKESLRHVLSGPVMTFVAGGQNEDGSGWDAIQRIEPADLAYIDALRKELRAHSLGLIVDRSRPWTRWWSAMRSHLSPLSG
jgi:hypothetical protein